MSEGTGLPKICYVSARSLSLLDFTLVPLGHVPQQVSFHKMICEVTLTLSTKSPTKTRYLSSIHHSWSWLTLFGFRKRKSPPGPKTSLGSRIPMNHGQKKQKKLPTKQAIKKSSPIIDIYIYMCVDIIYILDIYINTLTTHPAYSPSLQNLQMCCIITPSFR